MLISGHMTYSAQGFLIRTAFASAAWFGISCSESSPDDCGLYRSALLAYAECDPLAIPVDAIPDSFGCRTDSERMDAGLQWGEPSERQLYSSEFVELRECTALLEEHAASCVELRWNSEDPDETTMSGGGLRDRYPELRAKLRQCAFGIPRNWRPKHYDGPCEAWKDAVQRYTASCDPRFTVSPESTCRTDDEVAAANEGNTVQSCATLIAKRSYPLCGLPADEASLCVEGVARE